MRAFGLAVVVATIAAATAVAAEGRFERSLKCWRRPSGWNSSATTRR